MTMAQITDFPEASFWSLLFHSLCLKLSSLCAHILDLPHSFTGVKRTLCRSSLLALTLTGNPPGYHDKWGLVTSRPLSSRILFVTAAEKKRKVKNKHERGKLKVLPAPGSNLACLAC